VIKTSQKTFSQCFWWLLFVTLILEKTNTVVVEVMAQMSLSRLAVLLSDQHLAQSMVHSMLSTMYFFKEIIKPSNNSGFQSLSNKSDLHF
jgi:hypothetical protein